MIYFCCDLRRRNAVRGSDLNGIDFIEVVDLDAPNEHDRQKTLPVHLFNDYDGTGLGLDNVRIEGAVAVPIADDRQVPAGPEGVDLVAANLLVPMAVGVVVDQEVAVAEDANFVFAVAVPITDQRHVGYLAAQVQQHVTARTAVQHAVAVVVQGKIVAAVIADLVGPIAVEVIDQKRIGVVAEQERCRRDPSTDHSARS